MRLHWLLALCIVISLYTLPQLSQAKTVNVDPLDILPSTNTDKPERFAFQTEVQKVMKIIINSLYKTKEIFLRELISNGSDALDKLRFMSLTDSNLLKDSGDFNITIRADPTSKTLIITDTGIGMTKQELKDNLGTIAKSGTAEFLKTVEKNTNDVGLIGQFGVGFFAAYLVADRVMVVSKSPSEEKQYIWESDAENQFTITEDPRGNTLGRGTQIILHLKTDALDFLKDDKLKSLVVKYSEFINFPIYLLGTKTVEEDVPVTDEETKVNEEKKTQKVKDHDELDDDLQVDEKDTSESTNQPKTKKVSKEIQDWERVNTNKPIWTRPSSEINPEEYTNFYQSYFKDTQSLRTYLHFTGEGSVNFKAILFVPSKSNFDPLRSSAESYLRNIKLFVRRVFITDELVDFLPRYLSFLKGLIDSDDFPLNVSRETLQQDHIIGILKKRIITKALEMIKKLSANETQYLPFYNDYGASLKLGTIDDSRNRDKIVPLLRFRSSVFSQPNNMTSLSGYVERMRKGQNNIFFLTGFDASEIDKSPYIESLVSRGYEVLYLTDPIDEYFTQSVTEFDGKKLFNVAKGDLKFGDEDESSKKEMQDLTSKFQPLADWLTKTMNENLEKAVVSNRLTDSPCALVASTSGWTGTMEQLMNAQKGSMDPHIFSFFAKQKKILEINPAHPIIEAMLAKVEDDALGPDMEILAQSLLDIAGIRSGYPIKDTAQVATRLERAIRLGLGVDAKANANVKVKKAPEVVANAINEHKDTTVNEIVDADVQDTNNINHDDDISSSMIYDEL